MAAGASKRLGEPKQLIEFNNQTLIRKICKEALMSNIGQVTVVTGYSHDNVEKEVQDLPVQVFFNQEWEEGLGASIRNGLKYVLKNTPTLDAIIMTLVDQPYVDNVLLKDLAQSYSKSKDMIIASSYADTFGVPVLFDKKYFKEMMDLKGDEGGKKVFKKYSQNIVKIPFANGSIDIDEQKDLKKLI